MNTRPFWLMKAPKDQANPLTARRLSSPESASGAATSVVRASTVCLCSVDTGELHVDGLDARNPVLGPELLRDARPGGGANAARDPGLPQEPAQSIRQGRNVKGRNEHPGPSVFEQLSV